MPHEGDGTQALVECGAAPAKAPCRGRSSAVVPLLRACGREGNGTQALAEGVGAPAKAPRRVRRRKAVVPHARSCGSEGDGTGESEGRVVESADAGTCRMCGGVFPFSELARQGNKKHPSFICKKCRRGENTLWTVAKKKGAQASAIVWCRSSHFPSDGMECPKQSRFVDSWHSPVLRRRHLHANSNALCSLQTAAFVWWVLSQCYLEVT